MRVDPGKSRAGPALCGRGVLMAVVLTMCLLHLPARAEVAPVEAKLDDSRAWTGQRVSFSVELRARGSFSGTAGFDLPKVPGALLIKIGNPVVSSKEIEGETWFIQLHDFALFPQKSGKLRIPPIPVRFDRRDSFTGPVESVKGATSALEAEVRRPPGTESIVFLVTTESLEVTEKWDPAPGPAAVGAMFRRTIVQRARELPGMALIPAPHEAPEGVRIYPGSPETNDKTERGEFLGERRETLTYLLREPGTLELPELRYVWWNPRSEKLESHTLPAVTFEVSAPPAAPAGEPASTGRSALWLALPVLAAGAGWWQRKRLADRVRALRRRLNPPDRAAARRLLRACRADDAAGASAAWAAWRSCLPPDFVPGTRLRLAVLEMQRRQFGPHPGEAWQGHELAQAFHAAKSGADPSAVKSPDALPALNPAAKG